MSRSRPSAKEFIEEEQRGLLAWRKNSGRVRARIEIVEKELRDIESAIAALQAPAKNGQAKAREGQKPTDPDALIAAKAELETNLQALRKQKDASADGEPEKPALLSAIALSGGGIRSAIFSLGVMQALASGDLLRFFDYMSTVSGGGYIGSSLQWWWNGNHGGTDNTYGVSPGDFPYGTQDPDPFRRPPAGPTDGTVQTAHMAYLRRNGNYLLPGSGITVWSGVAVVLRAIFLNLFVWIPVLAGLMLLIMYGGHLIVWLEESLPFHNMSNLGRLPSELFMVSSYEPSTRFVAFSAIVIAGGWLIVEFFTASIFYSLYSRLGRRAVSGAESPQSDGAHWVQQIARKGLIVFLAVLLLWIIEWYNWVPGQMPAWLWWLPAGTPPVAFPLALLIATILIAPYVFIKVHAVRGMTLHYSGRRLYETRYGKFLKASIVLLILGTLPIVHRMLGGSIESTGLFGTLSTLLGTILGVFGHFKSVSKSTGRMPVGLVLSLGSAFLLYGILLLAYSMGWLVYSAGYWSGDMVLFIVVLCVALASMLCVDINYISLHRYYRDRLMEAFLPDWSTVESSNEQNGPAKAADGFRLSNVWTPDSPGPYPIINTNAVMVNADQRQLRTWGGDSFALTPIHCGSRTTEWLPTTDFNGNRITLPTAMAISGAAANPNTGVGGKGYSRGKFISVVMTLLNFRLGYWVSNPIFGKAKVLRPNHLFPGALYALFRYGYKQHSRFVELTDGGHFENIGLYELVRRKSDLIVVCDGEADKSTSYYSFVTVLRRIEDTFNASIHFQPNMGPELLIPKPDDPNKPNYPSGAEFSERAFFVAEIRYDGGTSGTIIYMKTTLIDDLSMKAKGYAGAHPDFPDETTADQFFDEEQFEAYRELGYRTAMQAIDALTLERLIVSPRGLRNLDWQIASY